MVGFISAGGGGPDYVQQDEPQNPQNGEIWFDTDAGSDGSGELKIYDGDSGTWKITGFTSHGDLTGVTRDAHHPPVEVSGPLTQPTDQSLGLSIGDGLANSAGTLVAALGNGLGIDGSGQVYVPANAVSQSMLGFDTATQGELDNHAGDTTNPHNVTDEQTGAASALSNHASDANVHHSPPTSTSTGSPVGSFSDADTFTSLLDGAQVRATVSFGGPVDASAIRVYQTDGGSYSVDAITINLINGQSEPINTFGGSAAKGWQYVTSMPLDSVEVTFTNTSGSDQDYTIAVEVLGSGPHSLSI